MGSLLIQIIPKLDKSALLVINYTPAAQGYDCIGIFGLHYSA